jgi:hypothetical protein
MRVGMAAIVAALVTSGWSAGEEPSGLVGNVLRGPVSPVCIAARPCQVPASAVLAFRRNGREVARVRSTKAGAYRVALPAGTYAVTAASRHPLWRILPGTVRVPSGAYARVNFLLDTGIR